MITAVVPVHEVACFFIELSPNQRIKNKSEHKNSPKENDCENQRYFVSKFERERCCDMPKADIYKVDQVSLKKC